MRRPCSPAPLPRRENQFQRAIAHGAGNGSSVDECERLEGGLSSDGRGQRGVAGDRDRLPAAGELGENERPCGITVGPGKIKTAQARGAPGQDKRTDDTDRLAA